jgi:Ca2+-transporting ATPase
VDGGSQDPLSGGLSEKEAATRLKAEGPNTLPQADRRTFIRIVFEILREPMFALLLGAAVIYLVLGDLKEAVVLGIFACTSVLIAVVQESRTERVLESLRDLTSPRALVIRDGVEKRIAGVDVVRGDLVILAEGDRVSADATVLAAHDLQCDESLLTGEAVPVRKIASPGAPSARPGGDDLPYVYSGCMVVRGHGHAEVTATGARSEIGKIGLAITHIDTEPPAVARPDTAAGPEFCRRQPEPQRARGCALWSLARRPARCVAERHRARYVDAAGGVPARPHRLHGDGRLAHFARPRPDPARRGY